MSVHYNYLNIGVWNIHGIFCNINKSKLCKLDDPEFIRNISSFDILCLQETLSYPKCTNPLSIEGFRVIPLYRKISGNNRHFGGSMLCIKNHVRNGVKIVEKFCGDIVWVKLDKTFFSLEKDLFVCFAYVPPSDSPYVKNLDVDILEKIEEGLLGYSKRGNVLLAGDINAKTGTERDFIEELDDKHSPINDNRSYCFDIPLDRENQDNHPLDKQGKRFLEFCKNTRMRILNGRSPGDRRGNLTRLPMALRESPSTLDYMACDVSTLSMVKYFQVLPHSGLSDHCCLSLSLNVKFEHSTTEQVVIQKKQNIKFVDPEIFVRRISSPSGIEKIRKFRRDYQEINEISPDDMCKDLTEMMLYFSVPPENYKKKGNSKRRCKDKPPWFNRECSFAKTKLNQAEKRLRKDPFNRNLLQNVVNARKGYKRLCKQSEWGMRQILASKLNAIEKGNPVEFWNVVKECQAWGTNKADPAEAIPPSEWLDHFQSLLNPATNVPAFAKNELSTLESTPSFTELDYRISLEEVKRALIRMNHKSAPGYDGLPCKFLVAEKREIPTILEFFFNKLFLCADYPSMWTENFHKSIFKKGDISDPNNYRGIAI